MKLRALVTDQFYDYFTTWKSLNQFSNSKELFLKHKQKVRQTLEFTHINYSSFVKQLKDKSEILLQVYIFEYLLLCYVVSCQNQWTLYGVMSDSAHVGWRTDASYSLNGCNRNWCWSERISQEIQTLNIYMYVYINIYWLKCQNWTRANCSVWGGCQSYQNIITLWVSLARKLLPVERKGVTINCDTGGIVVEQDYHQGRCALRRK